MKIIRYPLVGLLVLAVHFAQAQHPHAYTLKELTDRALTHNFDIRNQEQNREGTEAQIDQVKARALPQVSLNGDYKYYIKIPAQVIPLSAFGGPEGEYTTAGFGLPWNLSSNVQITQNLFSPSLAIGLKAAKLGREATELQIHRTKEDVTYNVAASFYNAQTVAQQIRFVEDNLKSLESTIRITDLRYQNQVGQKIDVDRLRLNYSTTENQLMTLRDQYKQLLNLLKFLSGIPQEEVLTIVEDIETIAQETRYATDRLNRSDLHLLNLQETQYELERRNIKAGALPTVSLYGIGNYGVYAMGGEYSVVKGIPAAWAGLQLNWSLFDGFERRSKVAQNKVQRLQLDYQRQALNESIKMEIENSEHKINLQLRNLKSSKEQVGLAEEIHQQAQLSFKEGLTDITTLIQTENSLREAQVSYLTAVVGLRTAELDLKKATGNLLN